MDRSSVSRRSAASARMRARLRSCVSRSARARAVASASARFSSVFSRSSAS